MIGVRVPTWQRGIWRDSHEWGPVYSMVMTEACIDMQGLHDRIPVILRGVDSFSEAFLRSPA